MTGARFDSIIRKGGQDQQSMVSRDLIDRGENAGGTT